MAVDYLCGAAATVGMLTGGRPSPRQTLTPAKAEVEKGALLARRDFVARSKGVTAFAPAEKLLHGGIITVVDLVDVVREHRSS